MDTILTWLKQYNIGFEPVLKTLILLAAASIVVLLLKRLTWKLLKRIERQLSVPHETSLTVARAVTALLWVIAFMLILNVWGVSVGGLWALLVSAAAVIGVGFLAFWTLISNITASFFITVWRPFRLGHTVELLPENLKGRVIDSNMMFTVLREEAGSVLQIPNNLFFQKIFRVTGSSEPSHFELLENGDRTKSAGVPAEK